jgi:hypothetical protein
MNKRISTPAALVAGALVAVALTPGSAVAASAKSVLLGRSNTASTTTSLSNTKGTPLALSAGKGQAPLKVNSSRTVTNLSADKLDGLSSGSFLRSTGKAADADKLDGLSSGSFARSTGKTGVVVASAVDRAARCPSGTVLTGGGGLALGSLSLAYSGPDLTDQLEFVPSSWIAIDPAGGALSWAVCYSPSGAAIKGAASTATLKKLLGGQAAQVQRLKAQHAAR